MRPTTWTPSPTALRRTLIVLIAFVLFLLLVGPRAAGSPAPAASGDQAWVARFNGPGPHSIDEAQAVTTNASGDRVFVAGFSAASPGGLAVLAYRARTGDVAWRGGYPFAVNQEVWDVRDIVVSADGAHVVVSVAERKRMAAVAFDARTGEAEWLWRHRVVSSATGLAAGAGKVFVAGTALMEKHHARVVVALRAASGTPSWMRVVHDPNGDAYAEGVRFDRGAVFVAGGARTETGWAVRTTAYEAADGSVRWADRIGSLTSGNIAGVSADGATVAVAGLHWPKRGLDGWGAVAYDTATGERRHIVMVDPVWDGQVYATTISPDASIVIFAGARNGTTEDAALAAVPLTAGGATWNAYVDSGGHDGVVGIVASPVAPRVIATAYVGNGAYAWRTYAVDTTTGAEIWHAVYRAPFRDPIFPRAIAIGAAGTRVYVVGYTTTTRSDDFATIAYVA